MIPRLSGSKGTNKPQIDQPKDHALPLPSRTQAQKIIQQFFSLIEHFQVADDAPAPETKQSIKRKLKERKTP